jgi:hypothetical protein
MLHGAGILAVIVLLAILFAAASGRVESLVVERLGDVLYWGASFVAALLVLLAAAVALLNSGPDGHRETILDRYGPPPTSPGKRAPPSNLSAHRENPRKNAPKRPPEASEE